MIIDTSIYAPILSILGSIAGFTLGLWKISRDFKKDKAQEQEETMKTLRNFTMGKLKETRTEIEYKINLIESEHENSKELYKSEINLLSKKVDDLRDELRRSNEKVVDLLHKALDRIN